MTNSENATPIPGDGEQTRLLHRIIPLEDWPTITDGEPLMKIAVIDLETTGLDPQVDDILEFAVAMITADGDGRILCVDGPHDAFNDPGRPIEPAITKLTGITDEMVAAQKLSPRRLAKYLEEADACLAFNAQFDRRHLEMLAPEVADKPWICAMADVPWADLGFDGHSQGHLLMQCGMFNPVAHRATDDVESLVNLLAHTGCDGRTILAHAMENAQGGSWRFEATDAPYRLKDALRRRGYKYSFRKVWHKLVRPADYQDELAWYCALTGDRPSIVPVNWRDRFRADWTWDPVKRPVEVASWRR